jgi:hypothetical protein
MLVRTRLSQSIWIVLASIVGMIACASDSREQTVPDPAQQKGYTSFVAMLSSLTTSANDLIQLERSAGRLDLIRQALTRKLIAAYAPSASKTISLDDVLDETTLLCKFRSQQISVVDRNQLSPRDSNASITIDHLATVARFNYLNSVANQIQSVSKTNPPGDILSALQALFASYEIKVADAALAQAQLSNIRTVTENRCEYDLKDFDRAYYGDEIKEPGLAATAAPASGLPSLSFLGPMGAAIDTVLGILSPIIIDAATIVDEGKRERAIIDFLSVPENQAAIRSAGNNLARAVSDYTFAKRLTLAGTFVEQLAILRTTKVDLTKLGGCNAPTQVIFTRAKSGAPSSSFMTCYHAVWGQFQSGVNSAISIASNYDLVADAGDTNSALESFNKITSDFSAISQNSITNPTAFWQYVTQLVTFAGAVNTAFSQDNRNKLQHSVDTLVRGL